MWHMCYLNFSTSTMEILIEGTKFLMEHIKITHHNVILFMRRCQIYALWGKNLSKYRPESCWLSQNPLKISIRMCSHGLKSIIKFVKTYFDRLSVCHKVHQNLFWQTISPSHIAPEFILLDYRFIKICP